jgi:hypothetical protein
VFLDERWHYMTWHGMMWCDVIWYWYIWYDMIYMVYYMIYDVTWYNIVLQGIIYENMRTRTHQDSSIPDKHISNFSFHILSELSTGTIILSVCWMPALFSLKRDKD